MYYERPASGEDKLGKYILTSLSLISSTSSIFTKDHLGGVSRGEGDGDSKWVSRLGWTGGVKGLECTSVGRKSIGVDSSTPKGLGVGKSSWCHDLVEVSGTFH